MSLSDTGSDDGLGFLLLEVFGLAQFNQGQGHQYNIATSHMHNKCSNTHTHTHVPRIYIPTGHCTQWRAYHFKLSSGPVEKVELLRTSPISSLQKLKLSMVHR